MAQTLRQFSETWERDVLALWKPSAARAARSHLRVHILPRFGEMEPAAVRLPEFQGMVASMDKAGKSRHMVKNVVQTLRSMLESAVDYGLMEEAPNLRRLRLPDEGEVQRGRWYSAEQVRAILEASPEPWRTLWLTAALTGLRCGEILGLSWDDVDFQQRVLHVRRSWTCGQMGSVKSRASRRSVPMPEPLAKALTLHRINQRGPNPQGLVFPNQEGRPLRADHVLERKLQPILTALGIPRAGFHAFRHAQATALVSSGADVKVAQAQLGHSDPRVTMQLYAHLIPEDHRRAVERVAEIFTAGGNRRVV